MPESRVTLEVDGERLTGEFVLPDVRYRMRYAEDGVHAVDEMAPDAFAPETQTTPVGSSR